MFNFFGIWPYVGYAFSLFFAAYAFYYSGIKGKLAILLTSETSIGVPIYLKTELSVRLGLVGICIVGVASIFYLNHRGVFK